MKWLVPITALVLSTALFTTSGCLIEENDLFSQFCADPCVTLTGNFSTGDGSAPLSDVQLVVKWDNTVFLGGVIRTKAKTYTKADGSYSLQFVARDDELEEGFYKVEIVASDKYLDCGRGGGDLPGFSFEAFTGDTTVTVDYYLPLSASILVRGENVSQIAKGDSFWVQTASRFGVSGSQECGSHVFWNHEPRETERILEVAAFQPIVVESRINKDSIRTTRYDTLSLNPGEEIEFVARYP